MEVLVGCEYSGEVRDAFIAKGHNAISCDLLDTDKPGPHHKGDIVEFLNRFPDGHFDLIICHPECTFLCVSGNRHYGFGKDKYHKRLEAAKWTQDLWELCKRKGKSVMFEQPLSTLSRLTNIPKAKYIQPYQFGHMEQKKTGLHLHNLEPLKPTNDVYEEMMKLPKSQRERIHYMPPSADRWKIRSTTYKGIAAAMAEQWGNQ